MTYTFSNDDIEEELLSKALYVDENDEDIDESQPPATAEEYLRRVIRERKQIEDIPIAANKKDFLRIGAIPEAPTHFDRNKPEVPTEYKASKTWQKEQIARFSSFRHQLSQNMSRHFSDSSSDRKIKFPAKKNEKGWCQLCFGDEFWEIVVSARKALDSDVSEPESKSKTSSKKKKEKAFQPMAPTTEVICELLATEVEVLIEYHVDWAELVGVHRPEQGLWMYALLGRLEKPLHPDMGSTLRTMVVMCGRSREAIVKAKEPPDYSIASKGLLVHVNLIICLVTGYFGQTDLQD